MRCSPCPPWSRPARLHGREAVIGALRRAIEKLREEIRLGEDVGPDASGIASLVLRTLNDRRTSLRPVVNATGVLLHTGLGRAPLPSAAADAVAAVARGYCDLEYDLEAGERGDRTGRVARRLCELAGAQAAAVVNNNAGATILALRALAKGREVIVSRGELIEIGGSFRLPEIMEVSGARLREVGTTNKTRLSDYQRAIGPDTAAILKVHPSNYRVVGFVESASIEDLAALARDRTLALIDDIGSGALRAGIPPGVSGEPTAAEGLAAGADLVLFSGDKLLGGPQCGILLGTDDAIGKVRSDPLARALRVDKMTIAALDATLTILTNEARAVREIPLWKFLSTPLPDLIARAVRLAERLIVDLNFRATTAETTTYLGGGSVPTQPIASAAVILSPPWPGTNGSEASLSRSLRLGDPAVVARIKDGSVVLDLKAMRPDEDDLVFLALSRLLAREDDRDSFGPVPPLAPHED